MSPPSPLDPLRSGEDAKDSSLLSGASSWPLWVQVSVPTAVALLLLLLLICCCCCYCRLRRNRRHGGGDKEKDQASAAHVERASSIASAVTAQSLDTEVVRAGAGPSRAYFVRERGSSLELVGRAVAAVRERASPREQRARAGLVGAGEQRVSSPKAWSKITRHAEGEEEEGGVEDEEERESYAMSVEAVLIGDAGPRCVELGPARPEGAGGDTTEEPGRTRPPTLLITRI